MDCFRLCRTGGGLWVSGAFYSSSDTFGSPHRLVVCLLPVSVSMRFSVLHLSDLHRDLSDEAGNPALLESLAWDIDQLGQQNPPIESPAVCIVSGDLVFGVGPATSDGLSELDRQCDQAEEFLTGIADRFFGGDHEKVVILPGNHDVSYPDVMGSVQRLPIPAEAGAKANLVSELFQPNSPLRWSWSELCFFRIADNVRYERRLSYFSTLYQRFYGGRRTYSDLPDQQYDVFDYPSIGFSVVALNSCYNNDPMRRAAAFNATAVIAACRALRDPRRDGWLTAAAWHHSLVGGPEENDYLDIEILQSLIDAGASLGFHGHQHRPDCVDERYRAGPSVRKMTIISAGTLGAGPRALPSGVTRGYNVVEVDTTSWIGRVHQRSMVNRIFNLPIWGPGRFVATNASYFEFSIAPPVASRPATLDAQLLLEKADVLLAGGLWGEAIELLRKVAHIPLARPLLLAALERLGDLQGMIELLWPPQSISEAIAVGGAIFDAGTHAEALRFVQLPLVSESTDASVRDLLRRLHDRKLR